MDAPALKRVLRLSTAVNICTSVMLIYFAVNGYDRDGLTARTIAVIVASVAVTIATFVGAIRYARATRTGSRGH